MSGNLTGAGSRILLVGTATHLPGSRYPDLPSVATTIDDLSDVLADRCGVARERITVLTDPDDPLVFAKSLSEVAKNAGDVFLLWFVGHGLLSPDGELHLATRASVDLTRGDPEYQALPYRTVRSRLAQDCQARSVTVVLDACRAGRAGGPVTTSRLASAVDRAASGSCLLASSSRDEVSYAPDGVRRTAFTGTVIDLLCDGDRDGGPDLTVGGVVRYLRRTLPERGLPVADYGATGEIGDLVLARNPAYRPPATPTSEAPPGQELHDDHGMPIVPYPGLEPFGSDTARFFHGRDRHVVTLVGRVARRAEVGGGPLFVVGASGSGKSSLVRAGLLPALGRGDAADGTSALWPRLILTPGANPLAALADVLAGPADTDPTGLSATLADPTTDVPEAVAGLVRRVLGGDTDQPRPDGGRDTSRMVLVVDQFEELFTLCESDDTRRTFLDVLAALTSREGDDPPLAVVVAVMRADFLERASAVPALADALGEGQLLVGAMDPTEIRTAIEQPARTAGLAVQPGLVDLILTDLGAGPDGGYDPGQLPLLAHALRETWHRRDNRTLTIDGYRAAGGIDRALRDTAENVYEELDPDGQAVTRRLLLALVRVSDLTRRRLTHTRLLSTIDDPDAGRTVLDRLASARLVTVDRTTVTITHEALIRGWPRLADWVSEDRDLEEITQEIEPDAERWHAHGTSATNTTRRQWRIRRSTGGRLYTRDDLAAVTRRLAGRTPTNRRVTTFLDASRRHAIRTRRLRTAGILGLVVLLAVTTTVGAYAFVQRDEARTAQRLAVVRSLLAQADLVQPTDPDSHSNSPEPHTPSLPTRKAPPAWSPRSRPPTACLSAGR